MLPLALLAAGFVPGPDLSAEAVAAAVAPYLEAHPRAAVVVGVTTPAGRAVYAFGAVRFGPDGEDGGEPAAPDGNTVFQLGSISKTLTGTVFARLTAEGVVTEDDPAADRLPPDLVPPRGPAGTPVTLRMLATHTAGLPVQPPAIGLFALFTGEPGDPYAAFTRPYLAKCAASLAPADPGAFHYSNLGAGLLGHALANADLGDPLAVGALFQKRLAGPLGLARTGFDPPGGLPAQLDDAGDPTPPWSFATLGSAGGVRSTADDVLPFADACLGRGPGVSGAEIAAAFRLAAEPLADAGADRVGLGWFTRADGFGAGEPVIWHNGGTYGSASFLAVLPGSGTAVVVLTNCGAGADGVAIALLK